jgi:predicted nucleic acid-binding protein
MPEVFVDAVAWIALINSRDSLHPEADSVLRELRHKRFSFVTTEFVLLELANALSAPDFRGKVSIFVDGLRRSSDVAIVRASSELFDAGFDLYRARPDKEWSLVDCTSFIVMESRNITDAFTEDRHFEQAGFVKLL